MQRIGWRIPAAWLTLCIVWSSTWLAIKVGLRDLPPISFVAIRFLIAIVALGGVALICMRLLSFSGLLAFWGGVGISLGGAGAAFSNVVLKKRAIQIAPAMLAAWQMIFGVIPLFILGFAVDGNPAHFHWSTM